MLLTTVKGSQCASLSPQSIYTKMLNNGKHECVPVTIVWVIKMYHQQ
jgi:hypothetical protein